ncbi:MAG: DUF5682 family protein [Zavarzinella sp.]
MATTLHRLLGSTVMSNPWQINVFGVRHLSPSGAWHLRRYLDRIQPDVVLIEGLHDAGELTRHLVKKGTKPPIAILAYTDSLPVRTLVYPLARYSPEFQAILWAHEHKKPVEFIDLPSDAFLALQDIELELLAKELTAGTVTQDQTEDDQEVTDNDADSTSAEEAPIQEVPDQVSIYDRWAQISGELNYDAYWERRFEHNLNDDAYRLAANQLGESLRELEVDPVRRHAENLVREAFMRRQIKKAIDRGVKPEKIVAVVGAYHAPVLNGNHPAMSDEEFASLRRRASKLTLMPYSYFRLSSQSGYGAGNAAPAYFELLWETLQEEQLEALPTRYLSMVARHYREQGTHRSTAEIIEAVRLAKTLSAMKDGYFPTLDDLHDAAIALLGHGERSNIAEALARVDVGTAIGELPQGVSRTSIQEDFDREIQRLKLEKYRTAVKQDLGLDLRENRQAKTQAAAYIDLERSSFLHRLRILGVKFAEQVKVRQDSATWAERWTVQWTPESEITLVESVLLGETIELACGYRFRQLIDDAASIDIAAQLVGDACQSNLLTAMDFAQQKLQHLASESSALNQIGAAAFELMQVVRYGDVRRFDTKPLVPLIEGLFIQACLALHEAANCDADAARQLLVSIDQINRVSLEFHDRIDEELWKRKLQDLSDADDRNPVLSGFACAIMLERGWMTNEALVREVSRRLSPGISADLGAGWFEGLAQRNRYALIARQILWEALDSYVGSLDEDQFRRSLVFLRRAFGDFSHNERRSIAENLAEVWGVNSDAASEALDGPLSQKEEEALEDLNDFDFGDI